MLFMYFMWNARTGGEPINTDAQFASPQNGDVCAPRVLQHCKVLCAVLRLTLVALWIMKYMNGIALLLS